MVPFINHACIFWIFKNVCYFIHLLLIYISRKIQAQQIQPEDEDDDVLCEKQRVLSGDAKDDVLLLENLTKVSDHLKICDRLWENPAKVIFFRCQCLCVLLIYITCRRFCAKDITVSQIFCYAPWYYDGAFYSGRMCFLVWFRFLNINYFAFRFIRRRKATTRLSIICALVSLRVSVLVSLVWTELARPPHSRCWPEIHRLMREVPQWLDTGNENHYNLFAIWRKDDLMIFNRYYVRWLSVAEKNHWASTVGEYLLPF
jgi:hypothetical protein